MRWDYFWFWCRYTRPLMAPFNNCCIKFIGTSINSCNQLMCKKPTYDASQKGNKRRNCVTFFWLVENYVHFSYSKCSLVLMESEIGEEDEQGCIWKFNQCATHVRAVYNAFCDSSVTHHVTQLVTHLWFICNSCATYMWSV